MAESIYSFCVCMADTVMRFHVRNIETKAYVRNYLMDGTDPRDVEYEISVSEQDIIDEWEYMLSREGYTQEFVNRLPGFYFEIFALHRKTAEALLEKNVLVIHGSCVSLDGNGYLFMAPSGKGKSTHAKLWCRYFGERAFIVNDDKPFLQLTEKGVRAYGSPWDGKHHQSRNTSVMLSAVGLIEPSETDRTEPLARETVLPVIFPQTLHPKDARKTEQLKKLLAAMTRHLDFYTIHATMRKDAPAVSCKGMSKFEQHTIS